MILGLTGAGNYLGSSRLILLIFLIIFTETIGPFIYPFI
jgi:hypothetical protein